MIHLLFQFIKLILNRNLIKNLFKILIKENLFNKKFYKIKLIIKNKLLKEYIKDK